MSTRPPQQISQKQPGECLVKLKETAAKAGCMSVQFDQSGGINNELRVQQL